MTVTFEADRIFWCHVLQISRWAVIDVYFTTFTFNFLFRMVLIRFSDRGLVTKGRPELRLFCQLYWIVFAAFFTLAIIKYPLINMIQGTFLQSTMARVCLLEPLQTEEKNISRRIETLVYPFLAEASNQYFSWKARVYIHGVCPNKRMSCIGKYRRNLMSFAETSLYLSCWAGYSVLEGTVVIVAMVIGSPGSTSSLVFWVHNFLAFAFIDVFHGIYIPLSMTLPSSLPTRKKQKLHPCAPGPLEPRRCWTSLDSIAASPQPPPPCPPPPSSPLSLSIGRTLQVTGLTVWQVCVCVYLLFECIHICCLA